MKLEGPWTSNHGPQSTHYPPTTNRQMTLDPHTYRMFRVKVGHIEMYVEAACRDDAIVLARRRLAEEHPRFYDVIRALEASRFDVRPAA